MNGSPEAYIDADGFLIDEAGEVVGRVGSTQDDAIRCDADADAALEVRSQIEGVLAGIEAQRRAFLLNTAAKVARQHRKLDWWNRRYLSPLTAYARGRISERHRTAQFAFGKVSFRKTPPHTTIIDEAAALAFVKAYAPELVVESVGVKAVVEASARADRQNGPGYSALRPLVVTSQPGESVTVSTGIEKEARQ